MVHLEDYLNGLCLRKTSVFKHMKMQTELYTFFDREEIFVHAISFFKSSLASLICSTMFKS